MGRVSENINIVTNRLPGYETGSFAIAEIPVPKYAPVINVANSIKKRITLKAVLITATIAVVVFIVIPTIVFIVIINTIFK